MTTKPIFIRITDNQLIQLAHIIGADYEPARPAQKYIDEEGDGLVHMSRATGPRLVLVITELKKDIEFEGERTVGLTATNVEVKLTGTDADRVWDILCCYQPPAHIAFNGTSTATDPAMEAATRILGENDFVQVTGIGNVGKREIAEHIRTAYGQPF